MIAGRDALWIRLRDNGVSYDRQASLRSTLEWAPDRAGRLAISSQDFDSNQVRATAGDGRSSQPDQGQQRNHR